MSPALSAALARAESSRPGAEPSLRRDEPFVPGAEPSLRRDEPFVPGAESSVGGPEPVVAGAMPGRTSTTRRFARVVTGVSWTHDRLRRTRGEAR